MITNKKDDGAKFVQEEPLSIADIVGSGAVRKKKRIRRIAEPHIEYYTVGEVDEYDNKKYYKYHYYRYRRGTDPPIHLGTADYILKAVQEVKNAKR